jgi:hypothetical protein
MSKLEQKIRSNPRVTELWDEDDGCFGHNKSSWWASLRPGYYCTSTDTGSIHEGTLSDVAKCVKFAQFDPDRYISENPGEPRPVEVA